MRNNFTPEEKYRELLAKCNQIHEQWTLNKHGKYRKWGYALCATPIQKGKGIILGINWGADDNEKSYKPNEQMPNGSDIVKYPFIEKSKKYLESHKEIDFTKADFNYSNVCVFRTPSIKELDFEAYKLSFPIFREYVSYINPPWLLSLGARNYDIFKKFLPDNEFRQINKVEGKRCSAFKMEIWGFLCYVLPHPQARLNPEERDRLWREVLK